MWSCRDGLTRNLLLATAGLGLACFFVGQIGRWAMTFPGEAPAIWPAAGIAFAGLLYFGPRAWPGPLLAAVLLHLVEASDPNDITQSLLAAVAVGLGSLAQALAGAWLVRRLLGEQPALLQVRGTLVLLVLGGLVGTTLSPTIRAFVLQPPDAAVWMAWWRAEALGVLLVAPLALAFAERHEVFVRQWRQASLVEALLLFFAVPWMARLLTGEASGFLGAFLMVPTLLWAALRFGPIGTAGTLLISALMMLGNLKESRGLIATLDVPLQRQLGTLQHVLLVLSLALWCVSALFVERQAALDAMAASERRYRGLVELAPDCILLLQEERIVYVNQAGTTLLGAGSPADLIGLPITSLLCPEDQEATRERQAEVLRTGRPARPRRYRVRRLDGAYIELESSGGPCLHEGRPAIQAVARDVTAEARAREALEKVSAFRETIIHTAAEGICVCYPIPAFPHVEFSVWNERMTELTGYTREEINRLGWHQSMYPDPDLRARAVERMARMRDGDDLRAEEWVITRKDGQRRTLAISTSRVELEDGAQAVVALMQDVTEQRHAADALRVNEERFRALVENAFDGINILGPQGEVVYSSPVNPRLLGQAPEDIAGRNAFSFIHPDDRPAMQALMAQLLQRPEEVFHFSCRLQHATEGWRHFEGKGRNLLSHPGVRGIVVNWRDMTERQQAEESLRRTESQLRTIIESEPECVKVVAPDGALLEMNSAGLTMIEADSLASVQGQCVFDLIAPEYRKAFHAMHARVCRGASESLEFEIIGLKGTRRWMETHATPLCYGPDSRTAHLAITRDITRRKLAEQALLEERASLARRIEERTTELSRANAELSRANQLKDEFLASMSHELRTPLTSILGLAEALREGVYGPLTQPQKAGAQTIEESGQHLLALINDILDLAKVEAGKMELEARPVAVGPLCQASLDLVRPAAERKSQQVHLTLPSAPCWLRGDERRLKQILVNLLGNAVKFTPEEGTIGLEVLDDPDNEAVHLTVWDTGIGIPLEKMTRLFQPFVQGEGGLDRKHGGTGLGLVLVERMVRLHGGGIALESEPGKGSRFQVAMPRDEAGPEPPLPSAAPPAKAATAPCRDKPLILIAEDTEAIANLISIILRGKGYDPIIAADGSVAVERAERELPDLILMDMHMPNLHGLDAIRRLRASPQLVATPILALTGQDALSNRENCLAAGATEFLLKPFTLPTLVHTIEELLGPRDSFGNGPAPPVSPTAALQATPPVVQGRGAARPGIILVAEDNEAVLQVFRDCLRADGHTVLVARNGHEAVLRAEEQAPHLVLMDVQMPGMHGLDAIRALRARPAFASVPIIAVTALAMPGDRERCLEAGADDYLSKPVSLRKLRQVIAARLGSTTA